MKTKDSCWIFVVSDFMPSERRPDDISASVEKTTNSSSQKVRVLVIVSSCKQQTISSFLEDALFEELMEVTQAQQWLGPLLDCGFGSFRLWFRLDLGGWTLSFRANAY